MFPHQAPLQRSPIIKKTTATILRYISFQGWSELFHALRATASLSYLGSMQEKRVDPFNLVVVGSALQVWLTIHNGLVSSSLTIRGRLLRVMSDLIRAFPHALAALAHDTSPAAARARADVRLCFQRILQWICEAIKPLCDQVVNGKAVAATSLVSPPAFVIDSVPHSYTIVQDHSLLSKEYAVFEKDCERQCRGDGVVAGARGLEGQGALARAVQKVAQKKLTEGELPVRVESGPAECCRVVCSLHAACPSLLQPDLNHYTPFFQSAWSKLKGIAGGEEVILGLAELLGGHYSHHSGNLSTASLLDATL